MYLDDKGTKVIEFAAQSAGFIRVRNIFGYGIMWKKTATITNQPQAQTGAAEGASEPEDESVAA